MRPYKHRQIGKSYFLFILIAVVAIGSGLLVQTSTKPPAELPEFKKTILLPTPKSLGEVNFTDHNSRPFTLENLKGKWSILFFAFTNCPDVCPTTMQTLSQVKAAASEAGVWNNYQVIMVTVDPERDDPERLKSYVPYFDPEFIGLTAPVDYTTAFAKNVGILFFKGEVLENGGYDMDHGASLILLNPQGQYAGVMTAPHNVNELSADLIDLASYAGVQAGNAKASDDAAQTTSVASSPQAQTDALGALTISNAWIRPAPPTVSTMAAYFDLSNNTDQDITIVGASSPEFDEAMVHQTKVEDGLATMSHIEGLLIPAKSSVTLTPLGTHLMLIDADKPLAKGSSATVTLTTADGRSFSQKIEVKQKQN